MSAVLQSSFVKKQLSKRDIVMGFLHPRTLSKVEQGFTAFDQFISGIETLVNLGTQISAPGINGKVQVTKDEIKEHFGEELFNELVSVAAMGREFLDKHGFESKSRVAPSTLIAPNSDSTASAVVTPYAVENPGELPTQGIKITTRPFDT